MKQASYSLIDFLKDPDFRDWVKHPNEERDIYWRQFQEFYPNKKQVLEQARDYVLILSEQTAQQKPSAEESQLMRQTIHRRIRENAIPFTPSTHSNWSWARMAASVVLVLGLGLTAYWYTQRKVQPESYQRFIQSTSAETALKETQNNDTKPLTIFLSDGSSVVLQPGSRLSYPTELKKREVYLVGKAFFEVMKDPAHPFLVYTRGIATKVLGTSFSIDAPETNQSIKVTVKTGKVAVYSLGKNSSIQPKSTDKSLDGMVLTSNQSAEYLANSHQLLRKTDTVSTFLQPGTLAVAKQSFDFDETPVPEVFRTLEKAYGVDISYNKSAIGRCSLSASLVGQPFHEKLSVICKALDAQYSIQGNQVVIIGGQRCQ